ncbi:MAG: hypothetical protein ABL921_30590 [Pirellula sp.]
MRFVINTQMNDVVVGDCAVQERPLVPELSCGIDLTKALEYEPDSDVELGSVPSVEFGKPLQDWFEMALQAETPTRAPTKNSWGEDDEEADEEIPTDDADDEEQDPFEDFDEDDFDDDFDDDFEEELDDEYEIEPADDGMIPGDGKEVEEEMLDGESEELDPGIEDIE